MAGESERETQLVMLFKNREPWIVVVESTLFAAIIFAAVFGNAILCFSFCKTRALRTPQNLYIICLAVADMLFGALCLPLSFTALITGKWPFGNALCQIQGSLIFILVNVSLFIMTLIALNRFVKMTKPRNVYGKIYSEKNIVLSILLCYVIGTLLVVALFSFGNAPFYFHSGKCLCFFNTSHNESERLYAISTYCVVSAMVFPLIIYSYFKVYQRVRTHSAQSANSGTLRKASRAFLNEAKITKVLFYTIIAFLICWTPSICMDLFEAFCGQYSFPRQVYFFQILTFISSSAVNPIIYGLMRFEVRMAYKRMLTCRTFAD